MQRVLIVKLAAIGDVIMALPLLTFLHEHYPGISISWVSGKVAASLVAATHLVDHLYCIDEQKLFQGTVFEKGKEVISLWKQLIPFSFDLVVTAHPDPRYRWLSLPIRKKKHYFFCRKKHRPSPLPGRDHSEEYLHLLFSDESCGALPRAQFPVIHCTLSPLLQQIADKRPIAIAPGGAKNLLREDALRRWPISHYVELVKELNRENIPVVLTGATSDEWVLPYFSQCMVDSLIGKTTLLDLVALYRHSRLLITHDSGPLHLGKLASCKTIALFGPTNPREFAGLHADVIWGGNRLSCAPCYDGKNFPACPHNLCMYNISVQDVLKRVSMAVNTEDTSIFCMHRFEEQCDSKPS